MRLYDANIPDNHATVVLGDRLLPTAPGEVLHSGRVLVDFLRREMPGARRFVAGEPPLLDELQTAGSG